MRNPMNCVLRRVISQIPYVRDESTRVWWISVIFWSSRRDALRLVRKQFGTCPVCRKQPTGCRQLTPLADPELHFFDLVGYTVVTTFQETFQENSFSCGESTRRSFHQADKIVTTRQYSWLILAVNVVDISENPRDVLTKRFGEYKINFSEQNWLSHWKKFKRMSHIESDLGNIWTI